MQWKSRSIGNSGDALPSVCHVCQGPIVESVVPEVAYFPDFEHGDTPGSIEFLEERHGIDLSDEASFVCSGCKARVDELLR